MWFKKSTISLISIILIGFMLNSCANYTAVRIKKEPPLTFRGRFLHLIWQNNTFSNIYMTEASLNDESLTGYVESFKDPKPYGRKSLLVNVYIDPSVARPDSIPGNYSIPIDKINQLEVFDYNAGVSIFSSILVGAASIVGLAAIIIIIFLITKESCPFVYTFNGQTYDFTGEIYSGAIFPGLERDDYLPLPALQAVDGQYQLKMSNQVREIQSTNLAELLVIDHPRGTDVLVDQYGNYQTFRNPQKPKAARSANQPDILPWIAARDSLKFMGDVAAEQGQSKDVVYLSFDRPKNTDTARLVMRAKNSYWLDYTLGQFFDQFGNKYKHWYKKQKNSPDSLQRNWSLEQGIPLSVYLKQNGEWKFVDYFNVIGPVAEKDIIMPIDISGLNSDEVQLKVESGFMFWELDYVGMDFSPQQKVYQQTVSLTSAIDHRGKDVTRLLNKDDKGYFVMPEIGNQAILKYSVPALHADCDRSVFLHSKGHYEVIRQPSGTPDIKHLQTFREAGKFGEFSRDTFLELKKSLSR